jgi:rhodanese-related sulfurtransferase
VREYNSDSLTEALKQPNNIKLIDLRESYEYALQHDQNFEDNVPLTQLVEFVHQHQHNKQQPLILACRSGSRSQLAAQTLLRLGFENVGHLKGGYALHQY